MMPDAVLAPSSNEAPLQNHHSQDQAPASEPLSLDSFSSLAIFSSSNTSSLEPPSDNLATSRPTISGHLPSPAISSRWWEARAEMLLSTFSRLEDIILVCEYDLFSNPRTPIEALSKQPVSQLDDLCRMLGEHQLISSDKPTKAEHIVCSLRGPVSPALAWDGSWLISTMGSSLDVHSIAAKLDWSICSMFCKTRLRAWVKKFLGYEYNGISTFLDAVLKVRNDVARSLPSGPIYKWQSLEEDLRDRHPLARWIVSTALTRPYSTPYDALVVFSEPILRELSRRDENIISILQRLSILSFRYDHSIVRATEVDWHKPFLTDFSFFEAVCRSDLQVLTTSITEDAVALFSGASPADACAPAARLLYISRHWSTLATRFAECAVADNELVPRLLRMAEFFQRLRNYHCMAAVGAGLHTVLSIPLRSSQVRALIESSPVWARINPEHKYPGCTVLMAKYPGLPFLSPGIGELQEPGFDPAELAETIQYTRFFARG